MPGAKGSETMPSPVLERFAARLRSCRRLDRFLRNAVRAACLALLVPLVAPSPAQAQDSANGADREDAAPLAHGGGVPGKIPVWQPLRSGLNGEARALVVFGEDLVVGGDFTEAGGAAASRVARWDGISWTPLGAGMNGSVEALAVWNGALIAGGSFTTAGGAAAGGVARWNGSAWAPLGGGTNGTVRALAVFDGKLVAAGTFSSAGGAPSSNIAIWNGTSWGAAGAGTDGPVHALAPYGGGLVAAGSFTSAGSAAASNIALWSGSSWSPLEAGTDGAVRALIVQGGLLLAAGDFLTAGGVGASRVAAWNGSAWGPLGEGTSGPVLSFALFDGAPAAGGLFDRAGGRPTKNVALHRTDGWDVLHLGPEGRVRALVDFRGGLVAGGSFDRAGGNAASRIARYACEPPPVPAGVAASSNLCGRVRVSWNDVPDELGYRVFRNGAQIAEVGQNVTAYDDAGAPAGTSTYRVSAHDGCGQSALSPGAAGSPQRLPARPGSLTASDGFCAVVHLSWGAAAGAAHYRIVRDGASIAVVPSSETSYDDHPPRGEHRYEVQAGNSCGWSAPAAAAAAAIPPPDPPGAVEASDTSCSIVRIDWDEVPAAEGYRLFRDGGVLVELPAGVLFYEDSPAPGTHAYAVAAGDSCGWSAAVEDAGAVLRSPDAPRAVEASDTSCSIVRVDWAASIGAAGYRVTRDGETIATLPSTATAYIDTIAPGSYRYGVSARNGCGWSAEEGATGAVLPPAPPSPPFLTATEGLCSVVRLAWGESAGADGYEIHRDSVLVATAAADVFSWTDSASAGTHRYALVARNRCGASDSVFATGSVLPADPGPPAGLRASDTLCAAVLLTWEASEGADSIRLLRDGELLAALDAGLSFYADSSATGTHVYSLTAGNACGWSAASADTGTVLPAAPDPVTGLTASRGLCSVVRLAWNAAPRAERYHVYRDQAHIATLPALELSYADTMVGSHGYWVDGANRCGAIRLLIEVIGSAIGPPEPVADLVASDTSCALVRLDWKVGAPADSLYVFRNGVLLATLEPEQTSYEDQHRSGTYEYEIELVNRCGRSARAIAAGTILPGSPRPPAELRATAERCDSVVVSWRDGSDDELFFEVLRNEESLALLPANTDRYADRPAPGTYLYEIRAVGRCASAPGGRAAGTRLAPPPAPALFWPPNGASIAGGGRIVFLWYPEAEATGYRFQACAGGDFADPMLDTLLAPNADSLVIASLPPGAYRWRVSSAAACGAGDFSPAYRFTREAIGAYGLSQRAIFFGHDPLGGPVGESPPDPEPGAVVIRNEGEVAFDWSIEPSDPWIRVLPEGGGLGAGERETLWVGVLANELPSGEFDGRLFLRTSLSPSKTDTVNVSLFVKQYPLGDCNGNGNLDERDIAALVDHLLDVLPLWAPVVRLGLADIDLSGAVGSGDLGFLPPLIGRSLLLERPDAAETPGEEGVLWIGTSPDSFVVSLEGTGDVRAGAVRLRLDEGAGARTVRARPLDPSIQTAIVQAGSDIVLLFDFAEGEPRPLDGGNRIDLASLSWTEGGEPSMEFVWGGAAPSGSRRFPIVRAEWYGLGGPGSRRFAFFPIRPNPFSSECLLSFELPSAMPVALRVFDPNGRLVRTIVSGEHAPGFHTTTWDGRNDGGRRVGLGLYFVRLETPRGEITRRSTIVR
ncbi:MAG: FlgD immunoglobulin-like domain containing protein [Candidatus Eisenbacteria bacterium]